jgi:hypothetical protein
VKDGVFVVNELYTGAELKRYDILQETFFDVFEAVNVPKNRIFWFFGCRFEKGVDWK